MLSNPIPAPNPNSLAFLEAVDHPGVKAKSILGIPGPISSNESKIVPLSVTSKRIVPPFE